MQTHAPELRGDEHAADLARVLVHLVHLQLDVALSLHVVGETRDGCGGGVESEIGLGVAWVALRERHMV